MCNTCGCKGAEGLEANTLDTRNYLSKKMPYGMMGGLSPTPSGKYRDLEPSRTKLYTFTYSAMKDGIDHLDEEGNQISVFAHTPKDALYMATQNLRLRENTTIYKYHINPTYSLDNDYNRENRLVSFDAEGDSEAYVVWKLKGRLPDKDWEVIEVFNDRKDAVNASKNYSYGVFEELIGMEEDDERYGAESNKMCIVCNEKPVDYSHPNTLGSLCSTPKCLHYAFGAETFEAKGYRNPYAFRKPKLVDTNKYEGHDNWEGTKVNMANEANIRLIADAPMLLEEVKDGNRIKEYIYQFAQYPSIKKIHLDDLIAFIEEDDERFDAENLSFKERVEKMIDVASPKFEGIKGFGKRIGAKQGKKLDYKIQGILPKSKGVSSYRRNIETPKWYKGIQLGLMTGLAGFITYKLATDNPKEE